MTNHRTGVGRAVDERAHLVGEAVGVGVEEVRAEAVDDQAGLGLLRPARPALVSQPALRSGTSTMVCGR